MRNGAVVESTTLSPWQMAVLKRGLAWRREDRPDSVREFFLALTTHEAVDVESQDKTADKQPDNGLITSDVIAAPDAYPTPLLGAVPETPPVSAPLTPLVTKSPDIASNATIARVSVPVAAPDSTLPIRSAASALPKASEKPAVRTALRQTHAAPQPDVKPRVPFITSSKHLHSTAG
jgi:hypothetical protein